MLFGALSLFFFFSVQVSLEKSRFCSQGRVALVHSANGSEHLSVVTEGGELHTCGCNSMYVLLLYVFSSVSSKHETKQKKTGRGW